MKCEICHENDAQQVWFRPLENGGREELYVCHACAERERVFGQERGIQVATMDEPVEGMDASGMPAIPGLPKEMGRGFQEALEQFAEKLQEMGLPTPTMGSGEVCEQCKMPLDEIRVSGRVGCRHCLEQFRATIEAMIEEAQGSCVYEGAGDVLSAREQEIKRLRQARDTFVAAEDYQQAKACDEALKALLAQETRPEDDDDEGATKHV
jgi:protein arginine kinase activator